MGWVFTWEKARDPRDKVPEGWPVLIRIGDGHWRRLINPNEAPGQPKWLQWPGVVEVMIPVEGQTTECWSEVWK